MYLLTSAEMREVDRKTIELGIPSLILMENAGSRVVELLVEKFSPLDRHRIVIMCGKGHNGGDGLVVARQLFMRCRPKSLDVLLFAGQEDLKGDVAEVYRMFRASGGQLTSTITPDIHAATIVIDALLGTGLDGPPRSPYTDLIREVNHGFPLAKIVSVDIPSGMASDSADNAGPIVHAHHTVTFTAPKLGMLLEPNAAYCGELRVGVIGSPANLVRSSARLSEPGEFGELFRPRLPAANKGSFGHVLVVGGSVGKTGAPAMTGLAAMRVGAGLVTVASEPQLVPSIAAHAPELMTVPVFTWEEFETAVEGKAVLAVGPGMGVSEGRAEFVRHLLEHYEKPVVVDADGLNNIAGWEELPARENLILTPHPGEMSRLTGLTVAEIQANRLETARSFAGKQKVTLVLKGRNTIVARPGGEVWINPTGGPAMAKGGTGDILTGLIAGMIAQFPESIFRAVAAAVWLHGRAGDLAFGELGDKCVLATDLLRFLPAAMEECAGLPDAH